MNKDLTIRALEKLDLEAMYVWENDRSLWNVSGYSSPFSKDALADFIEASSKALSIYSTGQLRFVVDFKGTPIGCVDIFDFEPRDRRTSIGVLIYKQEHRGKGYAKIALELTLDYLKSVLGVDNVIAHIPVANVPSLRLFESLGFERVGVLRRWTFFDGVYSDVVVCQRT